MRITSKGQVTIPIDIRQKAGLLPNTEVEFVMKGNAILIKKVENTHHRGHRLIEKMHRRATKRLTTAEIMALTRGQ